MHAFFRCYLPQQNTYKEAELCIKDLREAADNFEEEVVCASAAVEHAFSAYVDLLEDLRYAKEEQLQLYSEERLQHATNLKKLRKELDGLIQNT